MHEEIWSFAHWLQLFVKFVSSYKVKLHLFLKEGKGVGSWTCWIGLVNQQKIKVAERKRHRICLCAKHFYFHEQHLFSCVNPLLLCYRVLNMGRVAIFWRFVVIFTSLIANLIRGTATLQNEILTVLRFQPSPYSQMPQIQISVKGIEKMLKSLNPHKAAGPDQFKPIVLQTLHAELAPILQVKFQKSLDSGKLPYIWKEADVSPIFKKGDKSDPANYRPISLTCVLCKVLEHKVASNLTKHLTNSNILFELQHGFRENRSCETQLVMLVDEISKSMQMGKQTDLILLDFSKAFDKVAHEKLISKLHFYGIRGKTLSWVKDFLDSRSRAVVLNGVKSDKIAVSSGVLQGSVLGPILFLAYINDLPDQVKSRVRLFADDTAIYLAISSEGELIILQNDLHTLEIWEKRWDMSFNPSKCQVLHITRAKCPIQTRYILHGTVLESVPSAKYLGVTISDNLSWTPHIDSVSKKANQTLGFLKRNIKVHNKDLKSTAYTTLVRPQLEYASTVWSPHTATDITKLEAVQRRSARWATRDYQHTSSVTQMIKDLNWRSLEQWRIDSRLTLM